MWEEERSLGQGAEKEVVKKDLLPRAWTNLLGWDNTTEPSSGQPLTPSPLKFSLPSPKDGRDLPSPESRSQFLNAHVFIILRGGTLLHIFFVLCILSSRFLALYNSD